MFQLLLNYWGRESTLKTIGFFLPFKAYFDKLHHSPLLILMSINIMICRTQEFDTVFEAKNTYE